VSWRRRIRAGEAAVTAHGGSGARCSALTSASGGLVTTRGEGPCRHFKAHVAKIILVRAGLWGHLSNNHLPSPNSDSFFFFPPQKLEFGSRVHVPNYIFSDPGQEKTERRESFYIVPLSWIVIN
jgi:hypothetical protein